MKPFSASCEQNKIPIFSALKKYFQTSEIVFEIGSGTGQHAVYFAEKFPKLTWICSDQVEHQLGIKMWIEDSLLTNIQGPLILDVNQYSWPITKVDTVFSANTVHIMGWQSVEKMFEGTGRVLKSEGIFCLYGPFNYNGKFSSQSNKEFDVWLRQRDIVSGIRDFEALQDLADNANLKLVEDIEMPVNNRILVWKKK